MLDIALATVLAWIGLIFLSGPINNGVNNLKTGIPIFSAILNCFLSPNKKDGLKIPRLSKSNRFNSSSTKPLNLKYSPLFSEFAKPDETKT